MTPEQYQRQVEANLKRKIAEQRTFPLMPSPRPSTNPGKKGAVQSVSVSLRIPGATEWLSEIQTWSSQNSIGAYNSPLKLTMSGRRIGSTAVLDGINSRGWYWSSLPFPPEARVLDFTNSSADAFFSINRSFGLSVRLIVDGTFTQSEFDSTYATLTIALSGLSYGFVFNATTGRIWIDRNLGATQVATSALDSDAFGWLYQWGRLTDGHQLRDSATTSVLSSTDVPGHGDFITVGSPPFNWRNPPNEDLWQGVDGINNPGKP